MCCSLSSSAASFKSRFLRAGSMGLSIGKHFHSDILISKRSFEDSSRFALPNFNARWYIVVRFIEPMLRGNVHFHQWWRRGSELMTPLVISLLKGLYNKSPPAARYSKTSNMVPRSCFVSSRLHGRRSSLSLLELSRKLVTLIALCPFLEHAKYRRFC